MAELPSKLKDSISNALNLDISLNSNDEYIGVHLYGGALSSENEIETKKKVIEAREMRRKYVFTSKIPGDDLIGNSTCNLMTSHFNDQGIFEVCDNSSESKTNRIPVADLQTFINDYNRCKSIVQDKLVKSLSNQRLKMIEHLFDIHLHLNANNENMAVRKDISDFYSIAKVDTHIHLSAAIASTDFAEFVKNKIKNYSHEVVLRGKTLGEYVSIAGLTAETINSDSLNVQGDVTLFDRFDLFNDKYDPGGSADLKAIFLSTKNDSKGKYLAELTTIAHKRLQDSGTIFTEWRISVKGNDENEWNGVADWILDHELEKLKHNRWMIQQPRIFSTLIKTKKLENFGQLLQRFFNPLFTVTLDPSSNPKLNTLLEYISGFDSVDDESITDPSLEPINPNSWSNDVNPSYAYQLYHFWANLTVLNKLRELKGLNTFSFRPHCGESGDYEHLITAYILSNGIAHGINLSQNSSLQYLFYLDQIGIHVSPSSNNFLFLKLKDSPFYTFFKRGLNVSLSTDDPMIFHMTTQPLIEEYSICRMFWSLTVVDISEIAKNSVLQCGFPHEWKIKWLGNNYYKENFIEANDTQKSNIPKPRCIFRYEKYRIELEYILN